MWSCDQTDPDFQDFYIIPVANPDGYQYTWTSDRFWYGPLFSLVITAAIMTLTIVFQVQDPTASLAK